ncbi:MAG: hypothetical protein KF851_05980 [Pirellulaceae bacterium]|nr:hypothetical protein [Pirellulaceae bacterium]
MATLNKYRHTALALKLIWLFVFGMVSIAQSQEPVSRKITFLYPQLTDGKFGVNHYGVVYPTPSTEQVLFLKNSVIQEELELSPTQIRRLERVLDEYLELESAILAIVNVGRQAELSAENQEKLKSLVEELAEKFDTLLLPHQQSRLRELIVRCSIRRDGMVNFLYGDRMAGIKEFEFTIEQLGDIFQLNTKIGVEYAEKVQALKKEYLDAMEAALPKHAQDAYAKTYQEFLRQRVPPLDLIAWQLENRETLMEVRENAQAGPQDYIGFFQSTSFTVSAAGRLHYGFENHSPSTRNRVSRTKKFLSSNFFRQLSSTTLALGNELDLSDHQVAEITSMQEELDELSSQHVDRRTLMRQDGESDEAIIAFNNQFEVVQNRMAEEALVKLDSMLTPIQKEALKLMAEGAEFIYCGFPFALEFGNAGKRLKLTAAERDAIRAEAEKFMERIKEETREWEQEILDRFLDVMNEKQQEKLKKLLGDPLQHTGCDIEILITTLLSPRQNY